MASVRELKKDINFLATELLTEAYVKEFLVEDVDNDKIAQVLTESILYRNEMVSRANHPDGKENPKMVKAYFIQLRKEMLEKYLKIADDINNI